MWWSAWVAIGSVAHPMLARAVYPRSTLLPVERVPLIAAGVLLAHPGRWSDAAGLALATIVGVLHWFRSRTPRIA